VKMLKLQYAREEITGLMAYPLKDEKEKWAQNPCTVEYKR